MRFRCLGPVEAWADGVAIDLGEPQQRLVLSILISHAGSVVSTDQLADSVWGEAVPASARKIIQGYVSNLRRALGDPSLITSNAPGYRLEKQRCEIDAIQFADLVTEGSSRVSSDPHQARKMLIEALGMWTGTPFQDLAGYDVLRTEIVRLEMLRQGAVQRRIEADIYTGASEAALPELADLTARHPLDERLWALYMLALYRSGKQAEALRVFAQARQALAAEVGLEPSDELRLLEQQVLEHDPVLKTSEVFTRTRPPVLVSGRNPYKGLQVFEEADATDFFGRADLTRQLREAVARRNVPRLVAVAGPSGSGKSSCVRAGLLPALRVDGWTIAVMYPGSTPSKALTNCLEELAGGPQALLFIDQLEELFTVESEDDSPEEFLQRLSELVETPAGPWVLATIRTDFLDRAATHLAFARLLKDALLLVTPLEDHEVRDVIVRPAHSVGATVEPELVAAAVRDVANRAGALPLLEYALTDLFDRGDRHHLSYQAYQAAGGLAGSLARRADEICRRLGGDAEETVRQVFLRLVTLTDEGEPLRRRVSAASLDGLEGVREVLDAFGNHRLLTFDRDSSGQPTVEVAHEALLTQWPRLRSWIDSARGAIGLQRQLGEATTQWNSHHRVDDYLLAGPQLNRFSDDEGLALTGDERALLDRSRAVASRQRRRRVATAWAAIAIFGVLAVVAFLQSRVAQDQAREANARRIAGEAILALSEDPERSILLALEAVEVSRRAGDEPLPEAVAALQLSMQTSRLEARLDVGIGNAAVSPDGSLLVLDALDQETGWATNEVMIHDAITGDPIRTLVGGTSVVKGENSEDGGGGGRAFAFRADGLLAIAYESEPGSETSVVVWDPTNGDEVFHFEVPGWASWDPTWNSDGSLLTAASWDGSTETVTTWEVDTGRVVSSFEADFIGRIASYDEGTMAVTHGLAQTIGFYDISTGRQVDLLETPGLSPFYLAIDQAGNRLATANRHETLQIWDLTTRTLRWSRPVTSKRVLLISPDGNVVALTGDEGRIDLFDIEDGSEIVQLSGHIAGIWGAAYSPNGERLYTAGTDSETRVWDVSPGGSPELGAIEIESGLPFMLDFAPDGDELTVSTWNGTFERRDPADGRLLGSVEGLITDAPIHPVVNHEWNVFATVTVEGEATVRDLASGEVMQTLPACTNPRALSPDGQAVALDGLFLCGGDTVPGAELRSRVVEVATGDEVLDLGERAIFRAAFNPDGPLPGGRYLAVNILNGEVATPEVYDLKTGELVATLDIYPTHIRFDPTGQFVVSGGADGRVVVLDLAAVAEGTAVAEAVVFDQTVATGAVPGLAISPTGILATSAFDTPIIRLWNIHTGELVTEIRTGLDGAAPPHLAFSPDGEYLLYPDARQVLRRFYLEPERLISLAQSRVTRELSEEECLRYLDSTDCG